MEVSFDFQMCLWEALMYARPELIEKIKTLMPLITVYHNTSTHKYCMDVAFLDSATHKLHSYPCVMDIIPVDQIGDWMVRFKQRIDEERKDDAFQHCQQ